MKTRNIFGLAAVAIMVIACGSNSSKRDKRNVISQSDKVEQREERNTNSVTLPNFTQNDISGQPVDLHKAISGNKVTLIDFWASWCGPCRAEMPNVKACYEKYKDKGFSIVGISFDQDLQAWKDATTQLGITWPQLSDLKGWQCKAAEVYYIRSIPSTILFSPDGKVIATNLRGDELGDKLAELLDK